MRHNIDITIDVHDSYRVKSVRHERISGNDEFQLLQNFILMFNKVIQDIREQEKLEDKVEELKDDDIPF